MEERLWVQPYSKINVEQWNAQRVTHTFRKLTLNLHILLAFIHYK